MIGHRVFCTLAVLLLTASACAARAEEAIDVGVAVAPAGGFGRFPVSFYSNSIIPLTAAIQIEISYDSAFTPIPPNSAGNPDCTANPAAGKADTSFAFVPVGCFGTECTGIRATVESLNDPSPIPQDVELFACNVHPSFATPRDTYLLTIDYLIGSDELGATVFLSSNDGFVSVLESTPGDCDGNGIVPISEVIRAVNDSLGTSLECHAADLNQDGAVEISELLRIVNTALTCDPSWPCYY
jgi:hypothetical protein